MKSLFRFAVARLSEPSTWRGLFLIGSAAGITLHPELQDGIIAAGLALAGLLGVVTADPGTPAGGAGIVTPQAPLQ